MPRRPTAPTLEILAVCGLTIVALLLRAGEIRQALFGDELILFRVVHDRGLGDVLTVVHDTESTPPLHFVLAWAAAQIGDPTVWIRVPSLILGTATVPFVYLLGARTVGRVAGLIGAALVAIDPYAIFYGTEGRAYATLAFLITVSTLFLVEAVCSGRPRWWIAFALTSSAALYTHYTAIFVLAAQVIWVLWAFPERRRAILLAIGGITLSYLPWIPSFLVQRRDSAEQRYSDPDSLADAFTRVLHVLPGHPFIPLRELPGRPWLVLLAVALVTAAVVAVIQAVRRRRAGQRVRPSAWTALILLTAVATPVGVALYGLGPTSIFAPRSMIASLPSACLAIGALLSVLPRPSRTLLVAATLLAVGVGTVKTLGADHQGPPMRQVAEFVKDTGDPSDPVLAKDAGVSEGFNADALQTHLGEGRRVLREDHPAAWRHAVDGGSVFLVRVQSGLTFGMPLLAGPRVVLRETRTYYGFHSPVAVGRYAGQARGRIERSEGRTLIDWSLGRNIEVVDGGVRGFVDSISTDSDGASVSGWATDERAARVVDWVMVFYKGELVAVDRPRVFRPDLVKAYGDAVAIAGFRLSAPGRFEDPAQLRVVAVIGRAGGRIAAAGGKD